MNKIFTRLDGADERTLSRAVMTAAPLKTSRLAVSLSADDDRLLLKLRQRIEANTGKRCSFAEVVRLSLQALDKETGGHVE